MYRLPTRSLAVCVLLFACGAPAELDKEMFPDISQTGYDDQNPVGAVGGAMGTPANGGSTGTAQGGTTGAAQGGTATNGGTTSNGGSSSSTPGGASGSGGAMAAGGCPSDASTLFNRPGSQGGCADNGCHVPGGTSPDLVSPGVVQRLLNVASTCNGRPYIGAMDSFLADKISGNPPECNSAMPLFQPQALQPADEQCILDWVQMVGGGG